MSLIRLYNILILSLFFLSCEKESYGSSDNNTPIFEEEEIVLDINEYRNLLELGTLALKDEIVDNQIVSINATKIGKKRKSYKIELSTNLYFQVHLVFVKVLVAHYASSFSPLFLTKTEIRLQFYLPF